MPKQPTDVHTKPFEPVGTMPRTISHMFWDRKFFT